MFQALGCLAYSSSDKIVGTILVEHLSISEFFLEPKSRHYVQKGIPMVHGLQFPVGGHKIHTSGQSAVSYTISYLL